MPDDETTPPQLDRYGDLPVPVDEVPPQWRRTDRQPGSRPELPAGGDGSGRPTVPEPPVESLPERRAQQGGPTEDRSSTADEPETPLGLSRTFSVGIWGAPQSGKTLFLQMLPTAARLLGWTDTLIGAASIAFYEEASRCIADGAPLPSGTQAATRIVVQLDRKARTVRPAWLARPLRTVPALRRRWDAASITIDTIDRPGGDFGGTRDDPDYDPNLIDEVVAELRARDAILFLYDPTFDMDAADDARRPNTLHYFQKCLDMLRDRSSSSLREGALPQVFGVCVTKFDSVPVFARARAGFWATQDDDAPFSPRVDDGDAQRFFAWLCRQPDLHDSAAMVHDLIAAKFPKDRTRYFVTSAAGFRRDGEQVTLALPDNVDDVPSADGSPEGDTRRLWSRPPQPINVMEPLVALHAMAREARP